MSLWLIAVLEWLTGLTWNEPIMLAVGFIGDEGFIPSCRAQASMRLLANATLANRREIHLLVTSQASVTHWAYMASNDEYVCYPFPRAVHMISGDSIRIRRYEFKLALSSGSLISE